MRHDWLPEDARERLLRRTLRWVNRGWHLGGGLLGATATGRDLWRRGSRALRRWQPAPTAERLPLAAPGFVEKYRVAMEYPSLDTLTDPAARKYVEFAFSTIQRGAWVRDLIEQHQPIEGRRYLDVGCAYGGFLVAFGLAGARPVEGLEVSPRWAPLADALLDDFGLPGRVHRGSILADDVAAHLGRFDIITCNDVIEHVPRPDVAIANLIRLLAPGGVLYMEIPNRHWASHVLADGHFLLPALSVLPKPLADRYFEAVNDKYENDVLYQSLPYYLSLLRSHGATPVVINQAWPSMDEMLASAEQAFADSEAMLADPRIPEFARASAARHVRRLARVFRDGMARYRAAAGDEAGALGRRLWLGFAVDFWRVLVRK